jgi:hypothetical protein
VASFSSNDDLGATIGNTASPNAARIVRERREEQALCDDLSFTSFRHSGFTETGGAELTDRKIMAQGRKATVKRLPRYVKRTAQQIVSGTKKRRVVRTKG